MTTKPASHHKILSQEESEEIVTQKSRRSKRKSTREGILIKEFFLNLTILYLMNSFSIVLLWFPIHKFGHLSKLANKIVFLMD